MKMRTMGFILSAELALTIIVFVWLFLDAFVVPGFTATGN